MPAGQLPLFPKAVRCWEALQCTIANFVSRGLGISLLPDWSPMWGPNLALTRIPLPGTPPIRRIGFLRTVRGPRDGLVGALLGHAMAVCGTR